MQYQQTLKAPVHFSGKGLHGGQLVHITIHPAPAGHGIVFRRIDLPAPNDIPATIGYVLPSELPGSLRRTSLGNGTAKVGTVEHLLAALHGMAVDNALIEVDGEELPGLDGSAQAYADKIRATGCVEQGQVREVLVVRDPVYVESPDAFLMVLPSIEFRISYTLSYNHPSLRDQFVSIMITPQNFPQELAPARTFCLKEEAQELVAKGFGRGADFSNTLVFENDLPIQNELRFRDEAARHKMLDLMGDLYLLGVPVKGHVVAYRTGHLQNMELVRKLHRLRAQVKEIAEAPSVLAPGKTELNIQEIQEIMPHRYPFLLVDRIVNLEEGKRAVGIKNVTINEPFFQGHFPGHPIMPGVLIVEAMAQVGGIVTLGKQENLGKVAYFMSIDEAKFRRPVVPGDQLRLDVEVVKWKTRVGQCLGKAYVGDTLVAEASFKFTIVDR